MSDAPPMFRLEPLAGPPIRAIEIDPGQSKTLGRSGQAEGVLDDPSVSRMHARVAQVAGVWTLTDLGSKHGTYLNATRLEPEEPTPIAEGSLVRIGPWTLRVRTGEARAQSVATTADDRAASRIRAVPDSELAGLAQQRLDLLIDCAASITGAKSVESLAEVVLDACRAGAGYARAALVRPLSSGGEVEVLAARAPAGAADDLRLSRSLIEAASEGRVVRLEGDTATGNEAHSIISLGIHSATCVPVMLGRSVEACLYLDARDAERRVTSDSTAFCLAIARLAGLALANIRRVELERSKAVIESDLRAARAAQRLMLPPASGQVARVRYAMSALPGRYVAGDLFDVVELGSGAAVLLGDVTGKGAGAAMLMAMVQTHLRLALRHHADPALAIREVNASIAPKLHNGQFISLWLGVFDPGARTVRFVDAGHGHCLVRPAGARPEPIRSRGGLPIGLDADCVYENAELALPAGSRVILFSDGAVEQAAPSGELFGLDRVIEALEPGGDPEEDVRRLVDAVRAFSQAGSLGDDLTIASVDLDPDASV